MTALDQAFIKAFTQRNASPAVVVERTSASAPSSRGKRRQAKTARRRSTESGQSTKPKRAVAERDRPRAASKPQIASKKAKTAMKKRPNAASRGRSASSAQPKAARPNLTLSRIGACEAVKPAALSSAAPSPANASDGFWALLENTSKKAVEELAASPLRPAEEKPPVAAIDVAGAASVERELNPAWRVDHFSWPRVCRRLFSQASDEMDRLADALMTLGAKGQKVLAFGGVRGGEGATTLLLCAARRLAERGVRLAMIDADGIRPRLAKRLGVQPQSGWNDAEDGGAGFDRSMLASTADNLALLPLCEPDMSAGEPEAIDPTRLSRALRALRHHFDMVLVDLGPLQDAAFRAGGEIDAAVLVHNQRITTDAELSAVQQRLAAAGVSTAGIIENFVPEE